MPRNTLAVLAIFLFSAHLTGQDPLLDQYYAGAYGRVIVLAGASIANNDTAFTTWYLKAMAEEQLGRTAEAIRTLELARSRFPDDIRFTRMLARQYAMAGDYLKARDFYTRLVLADSNDVSAWLEIAEIASFRQRNPEAIAALEEVLRIDSINLQGLMMMGEILDRHNNTGALVYYRRALRLYPENQRVAYALSNWYIKARQAALAVPICESILRVDTTNIRFNKLLGYAHYKTGNPQVATTYLGDATRLGDSTAFVFKFLGISHYLQVDFDNAIYALRQSLSKDSLDAEVHFFLGASLSTTRDKQAAMYHLEHSLELMQPDSGVASRIYSEQANIHRLEGRYEESYRMYSQSYQADSSNVMSLYLMASIQDNSLDNDSKALEDYEHFIRVLDRMPESKHPSQSGSIREIVEDRIISLKEEIFFRDDQ